MAAFWPADGLAIPPGNVLPYDPLLPLQEGGLSESALAPDGSILLRGDFTGINGVARPGVALLSPDGLVDKSFVPESAAISGPPQPVPFMPWPPLPPGSSLLALTNGTWIHSFPGHALAYRPEGTLDARYAFLNACDGDASVLFETGAALYFLRYSAEGRALKGYRNDTFERLPLNVDETWPVPAVGAAPATDGRLWVLGQEPIEGSPWLYWNLPPYHLFRVAADGEIDPTFDTVELPANRGYRIEPRVDGGFRLIHWYEPWPVLWPMSSYRSYAIDLYDANGVWERSRSAHLPQGVPLLLAEEASGALLHNLVEEHDGQRVYFLVRILADGSPDPDFRIPLEALSLHLLPDGRIHHSHVRRILPDGTPDPSWEPPQLLTDPAFDVLGMFADGGILIRQNKTPLDPSIHPLMSLDASLEPDGLFLPPPDLPAALSYHLTGDREAVLVVLRGIHEFPGGTRTRILRLNRDGSVDPDSPRHVPGSGFSVWVPDGEPIHAPYTGPFHVHPLPDGRMLVRYVLHEQPVPRFVLYRLLSDGSTDPDFSYTSAQHWMTSAFVLSDGRFLVHNNLHAQNGALIETFSFPSHGTPITELPDGRVALRFSDENNIPQLALWDLDDGMDPAFHTGFHAGTAIRHVWPLPDDSLMVEGHLNLSSGSRHLVRLYPDGRFDPTFMPPMPARTLPWTTGLWSVVRSGQLVSASFAHRARDTRISSASHMPDQDALLVAGDFTHLGETPRRGLALLSLHRVNAFTEWLEVLFAGSIPDTPEEYLEDYATGGDPFTPARPRTFRPVPDAVRTMWTPLNPDAADVEIEFEVSTDLEHWRTALPGEILSSPDPRGMRLSLSENFPSLFMRIRYRIAPE